MRIPISIFALLGIAFYLLFLPCSIESKSELDKRPKSLRLKLPEIFNWSKFKESFHKVYPNLRDELARQKLFLINALKTFAHNIGYRWGKSSHFLGINSYCDWTVKEVKSLYNFRHDKSESNGKNRSNSRDEIIADVIEGVSMDDIKQELVRILEEKPEGYKMIAQGLEIKIDELSRRQKRSATEVDEIGKRGRKRNIRYRKHLNEKINAFRANTNKPKESGKYKRRVPSTNPNYQPVELLSQANSDVAKGYNPLPENYIEMLETVPGVVQVRDKFSSLLNWFNQARTEDIAQIDNTDEAEEDNEFEDAQDEIISDKTYLDYRESGCLTVPRDQDQCGACYAFATISLMEWMNCNQTGVLVPFSEQYMVDCGNHAELDGCDGGDYNGIYKFNMDWGVELLANYPFMGKETLCPYGADEWERAGYKKPIIREKNQVDDRTLWAKALERSGPILVSINIPLDFHLYHGGVHEGDNCSLEDDDDDSLHAMLLVGHGVEDGQDYWLIRNSHGFDWGELGYFKLSKSADDICFDSAREFTYDFLSKSPPIKEIRSSSGKKRRLSPSELEEKIYADILLQGYSDLMSTKISRN